MPQRCRRGSEPPGSSSARSSAPTPQGPTPRPEPKPKGANGRRRRGGPEEGGRRQAETAGRGTASAGRGVRRPARRPRRASCRFGSRPSEERVPGRGRTARRPATAGPLAGDSPGSTACSASTPTPASPGPTHSGKRPTRRRPGRGPGSRPSGRCRNPELTAADLDRLLGQRQAVGPGRAAVGRGDGVGEPAEAGPAGLASGGCRGSARTSSGTTTCCRCGPSGWRGRAWPPGRGRRADAGPRPRPAPGAAARRRAWAPSATCPAFCGSPAAGGRSAADRPGPGRAAAATDPRLVRAERRRSRARYDQTPAYIDLLFAFGMARLGEVTAARGLLRQAAAAIEEVRRPRPHTFLLQAFQYRVEQALAGRPHAGPLPTEQRRVPRPDAAGGESTCRSTRPARRSGSYAVERLGKESRDPATAGETRPVPPDQAGAGRIDPRAGAAERRPRPRPARRRRPPVGRPGREGLAAGRRLGCGCSPAHWSWPPASARRPRRSCSPTSSRPWTRPGLDRPAGGRNIRPYCWNGHFSSRPTTTSRTWSGRSPTGSADLLLAPAGRSALDPIGSLVGQTLRSLRKLGLKDQTERLLEQIAAGRPWAVDRSSRPGRP